MGLNMQRLNRRFTALTSALILIALLGDCAITHYEARGEFGDTSAVLHWKEGDSALTLWRCGAVPIPLTRGIQGQDDTFASDDNCVHVDGRLDPGAPAALDVYCDDPRYPDEGRYSLADINAWRQFLWFSQTEPVTPDPYLRKD